MPLTLELGDDELRRMIRLGVESAHGRYAVQYVELMAAVEYDGLDRPRGCRVYGCRVELEERTKTALENDGVVLVEADS